MVHEEGCRTRASGPFARAQQPAFLELRHKSTHRKVIAEKEGVEVGATLRCGLYGGLAVRFRAGS
jgi:hypothetical protein